MNKDTIVIPNNQTLNPRQELRVKMRVNGILIKDVHQLTKEKKMNGGKGYSKTYCSMVLTMHNRNNERIEALVIDMIEHKKKKAKQKAKAIKAL